MRFIWAGKKPRLKMKIMCDAHISGGFQVPNFRIYHEAICLTWLSRWMVPNNRKLLNLEGFNKKYGWHAYLIYDKVRMDNTFKHHYVRQPLLECWIKYKPYLPKQVPMWVIPKELLDDFLDLGSLNSMQYWDLLTSSDRQSEFQFRIAQEAQGTGFNLPLYRDKRKKLQMMTRWYITPKKLAKIDKSNNDRCWKCKTQEGSFYHLWLECSHVKKCWSEIHRELQKILKYDLPLIPDLYFLGLRMMDIDKRDRVSLWYMISATQQLYVRNWKTENIPTLDEQRQLILKYAELDKLMKNLMAR